MPPPTPVEPIAIHVAELSQLFDPLDPSPFGEKDLRESVEKFIIEWARELRRDRSISLVVYVDTPAAAETTGQATAAIHATFERRAESARHRLRQLFRLGRVSLAIGLAFLTVAVGAAEMIGNILPRSRIAAILSGTLEIGGWVAMWRPLETFLYDWWPIRADVRLFRRLAAVPVSIERAALAGSPATRDGTMKSLSLGVLLVLLAATAAAQTPPAASPAPTSTPRAADVSSVDSILSALYGVISGPAGQQRDWDRFRSLFSPGARLIPTGRRPDGTHLMRVLTPDDYVATSGPFLETNGFFEREIARRTEEYGGMVHVFSTYESRRTAADSLPFMRGINSIQLVNDGRRWWVVTVLWEGERGDNPIPGRYLHRDQR